MANLQCRKSRHPSAQAIGLGLVSAMSGGLKGRDYPGSYPRVTAGLSERRAARP